MHLYISNLDPRITSSELEQLFLPYGNVQSATVEFDAFTGKSRGFGYVTMAEGAGNAIAALHQTVVGRQVVSVAEAPVRYKPQGSYKPSANPYRFGKN